MASTVVISYTGLYSGGTVLDFHQLPF